MTTDYFQHPNVTPGDKWIVFDIDRTLINCTAWFYACSTPGLLIDPELVADFKKVNDRRYGPQSDIDDMEFRRATLELIARSASVQSIGLNGALAAAGSSLGAEVVWYREPFEVARIYSRLFGPRLRILYLTAGYEPFALALVECLHRRAHLEGVPYTLHGSTIRIANSVPQLDRIVDRATKVEVVQKIRRAGGRILCLADDDLDNRELFAEAEADGALVHRVVHRSGEAESESWRRLLRDELDVRGMKNQLMAADAPYGLARQVRSAHRNRRSLDRVTVATNRIGIRQISQEDFLRGLASISSRLGSSGARFAALVTKLVHCSGTQVTLRGSLFYADAPPYLFADSMSSVDRWTQQLDCALEATAIIEAAAIPRDWTHTRWAEQQIVLAVLDHLKNAITQALQVIHRAPPPGHVPAGEVLEEVDRLAHLAYDHYWAHVFDKPAPVAIAEDDGWVSIRALMRSRNRAHIPTRELDDPGVVALSVLSLIDQLNERSDWPVAIIDFGVGGLELGLSFKSIASLVCHDRPRVGLAHMYYSSKGPLRGTRDVLATPALSAVRRLFPPHHAIMVEQWLASEGTILLYDNNVATFGTLKAVKAALLAMTASANVQAAVSSVYYDNMARYALGLRAEPLTPTWQDVLDYSPVADYVTAFSTWGTSEKSLALQSIFGQSATGNDAMCLERRSQMFKICRVHNIVDLASVLNAGANAIGIHAVAGSSGEYLESQRKYRPLTTDGAHAYETPVHSLEVASIRAMAEVVPRWVAVALVLERWIGIDALMRSVECYGLSDRQLFIQCQHRLSATQISALKEGTDYGIIAAVGVEQEDFHEYVHFLDSNLRCGDFLLVDASTHQPDFLMGSQARKSSSLQILTSRHASLRDIKVPILLASDDSAERLFRAQEAATAAGIRIAGVDTQNGVEVDSPGQRFRLLRDGDREYQALIRKSPDLLAEWRSVFGNRSQLEQVNVEWSSQ